MLITVLGSDLALRVMTTPLSVYMPYNLRHAAGRSSVTVDLQHMRSSVTVYASQTVTDLLGGLVGHKVVPLAHKSTLMMYIDMCR